MRRFVSPTAQLANAADEFAEEAAGTTLQRVDEAAALARPNNIGQTWVEKEYDERATQQKLDWAAAGDSAAQLDDRAAEETNFAAEKAKAAAQSARDGADEAEQSVRQMRRVLGKYRHRRPRAAVQYWLVWFLLLGGDVAGIAGAAILRGEIVALAFAQSISLGVAAITAGRVGDQLRDAHDSSKRECPLDELSEDEKPFAHLFRGGHTGETMLRVMASVALTILATVSVGIFSLRAEVDGALSGLTFGCLAATICLASAINCYSYADEVADLIDSATAESRKEQRQAAKLAKAAVIRLHDGSIQSARSIRAEYAKRGDAAAHFVWALKYRVLRNSPGVVGHGPDPTGDNRVQLDLFELVEPEHAGNHHHNRT